MNEKKSAKQKRLYFIALVTHKDLSEKITRLKMHMAKHYGSKNALKSPPHITLFPPFHFEINSEDKLIKALDLFTQSKEAFKVNLEGFNVFSPRVIYIDVEPNNSLDTTHNELLHWLKTDLGLNTAKEEDREFKPHMTLASRDLTKPNFFKAWKEFKDQKIQFQFTVDALILLAHNGKSWDILHKAPFKDYQL